MKLVWKCDFCSKTDWNINNISKHEKSCSFNKINKKCYTCKFSFESGYNGEHLPGCEINLDTLNGEENGNCSGWVYEYLDEDRDRKLKENGI